MSASPDLHPTTSAPNAAPSASVLSVPASGHLSADEVDDHLIGCLAAQPAAHLAACPLCTRRVAAAADPLASFRRVTTAWSERRSATLTTSIRLRQRPLWQRHLGWATACLTVAVGIALTTSSHGWIVFGPSAPQPATQQTAPQDATQQSPATTPHVDQVSADNQMLQNIDDELDTSAETPAALGLQAPNDQPAAPPTALQD